MGNKTKMNNKTYRLVLSAVLIAIATVLNELAVIKFPYGGSVTVFSQVPIITLGYIFGPAWGLLSGFVYSLVQMMFGFGNFSYVKGIGAYFIVAFFDYILPYTVLGLGGAFKNKIKNIYASLTVGTIMVCIIRFLCHFISGATVWADYTGGKTLGAVLLASVTYNGGYMLPETIVSIIGILALAKFLFPRLDENGVLK